MMRWSPYRSRDRKKLSIIEHKAIFAPLAAVRAKQHNGLFLKIN
jgi:hypothetical protein